MKDLIKISIRDVGLVDVVTARLNPRHVRSHSSMRCYHASDWMLHTKLLRVLLYTILKMVT